MEILGFLVEYSLIEGFLLVTGGVTVFYIVVNFFTSFNEVNKAPTTDCTLSFEKFDLFKQTLAYAINSEVGNVTSITTLANGDEFIPDFLAEMKSAKEYIYITNYLWEGDEFGDLVFNALIEAAKRGIKVRVLVDGIGGRRINKKLVQELIEAGGYVSFFRPLRWWNINRWNRRNHMRDIVIDGTVGYLGGIAFTKQWLGNGRTPMSWHDYMFKVDGSFAKRLEAVFTNLWSHTTGEILQAKPAKKDATISNGSHFILLFSSPMPDRSSDMEHLIWMSIMAAKKSILIENPYILPSRSIKRALIMKAKEGVEVKIIGPTDTDAKHVKWASQSYYAELLRGDIRLFEYGPARIHAKTMVVDGVWSIIGSANLDNRSRRINLELVAGTDDKKLSQTLVGKFEEDLEYCMEITKDSWGSGLSFFTPIRLLSRVFVRQY